MATGYLALDVILQVEVLVERPVDEFGEKNLTSVVGVNLKKTKSWLVKSSTTDSPTFQPTLIY